LADTDTLDIGKHKEMVNPRDNPVPAEVLDASVAASNPKMDLPRSSHLSAGSSLSAQPEAAKVQEQEKTALKPIRDPKKAGNLSFNLYNFLGLHWFGNSSLSLWITYNVMTKPKVSEGMHTMAKGLMPIAAGYYKVKSAAGLGKTLLPAERILKVTKLARSWTEVACMTAAGSIILFPVKWSEDHRQGFVDFFDNLLHPAKKQKRAVAEVEAKAKGITLPPIEDVPHHKETWTNLIRARVLALFPIFAIDIGMENWNIVRAAAGKGNFDTAEWGWGKRAYENMNPASRERFVKFFSSKGIKLSGVQYMMRDKLLHFIGSPQELKDISKEMADIQHHAALHPKDTAAITKGATRIAELEGKIASSGLMKGAEKAIFAEQARMFSKEVSLTLIYTGFLFVLGKTGLIPYVLDKIGIKSKKEQQELEHALKEDAGLDVFDDDTVDAGKTPAPHHFTDRIKPRDPARTPPELFYARKLDEAARQPALQMV